MNGDRTCCPSCGQPVIAIRRVRDVVTFSPCGDTGNYREFSLSLRRP